MRYTYKGMLKAILKKIRNFFFLLLLDIDKNETYPKKGTKISM